MEHESRTARLLIQSFISQKRQKDNAAFYKVLPDLFNNNRYIPGAIRCSVCLALSVNGYQRCSKTCFVSDLLI